MLEDYVSCNRKVYYRLNRSEQQIQNREMIIGEIVHFAIEKFWDDYNNGLSYIEKEMSIRLSDSDGTLPTRELNYAQTCFTTYWYKFRDYLTPNDVIEYKFKVPYDSNVFIVGKIDRISNGNIFDWKTARNPPKNISGNIQFLLYNWAYRKLYDKQPNGVYYAALSTGALIKLKPEPFLEDIVINDLIPNAVRTVKSKDFIRSGMFNKSCFRCTYSQSCLKELSDELDLPVANKE